MKDSANYTLYHPRWYRKRVSTYWWTQQWRYLKFILRELSSLSVIYAIGLLLYLLHALSKGPGDYAAFLEWLRSPFAIIFNLIAFIFVIYHAITWFNLAPRAMPVRLGGKRLPDWMVAAPNYVAWLAISAILAWFILRGE